MRESCLNKRKFSMFEFRLRLRISNGLAGFFFGSATDSVQDNLVEALPLFCLVHLLRPAAIPDVRLCDRIPWLLAAFSDASPGIVWVQAVSSKMCG